MTHSTSFSAFKISCNKILIALQVIVFIGWLFQLVLYQTWRPLWGDSSRHHGMLICTLIAFIPLIYSIICLRKRLPLHIFHIEYQDCLAVVGLLCLGVLYWYFFCASAIYYPVHTYGDENCHNTIIPLMAQDLHSWFNYFTHHTAQPPNFRASYMLYPSLAYIPAMLWLMAFGDPSSIVEQRMFLVIQYLAVVFTTYLLARLIIKSRIISILTALLPLSSALLLSYTMSFYIELHYVSVLILSFWLLAWGIRNNSKEVVVTSVLMASLAAIIRESAMPGTFGIILAALIWRYLNVDRNKKIIVRALSAIWYLIIGLLPFFLYYLAKSHYTNEDKTRVSLTFLLHQDYSALLTYSLLYLGPLILGIFLFFILNPSKLKQEPYLILAAVVGIGSSLFMQSIFIPGYMPWTHNYLFYYAQFIVLLIITTNFIRQKLVKGNLIVIVFLCIGIIANITITIKYLNNDQWFNESETIFDIRPIAKYMTDHQQAFNHQRVYLYWPKGFPSYPIKLLPDFIKLTKINSIDAIPAFLDFNLIQQKLPAQAHYLLFYWLKNVSRPKKFHSIPAVRHPQSSELKNYHILIESVDSWSQGRSGVMLLEKN